MLCQYFNVNIFKNKSNRLKKRYLNKKKSGYPDLFFIEHLKFIFQQVQLVLHSLLDFDVEWILCVSILNNFSQNYRLIP